MPAAWGYIQNDFRIGLGFLPASSIRILVYGLDQGLYITDKIHSEHCAYQRSFLEYRSTDYSSIADL